MPRFTGCASVGGAGPQGKAVSGRTVFGDVVVRAADFAVTRAGNQRCFLAPSARRTLGQGREGVAGPLQPAFVRRYSVDGNPPWALHRELDLVSVQFQPTGAKHAHCPSEGETTL